MFDDHNDPHNLALLDALDKTTARAERAEERALSGESAGAYVDALHAQIPADVGPGLTLRERVGLLVDLAGQAEGHKKAHHLMQKGMESQSELMHELKQDKRSLESERDRLKAILDSPVTALFADGREPTQNERHLLNLLAWREKEAREAKADAERMRKAIGDEPVPAGDWGAAYDGEDA